MHASDSEGLGLSVLLYLGAVLGALALFAVPAYFATRAQVYENPALARADPLLNGPIIGNRVSAGVPLARLKQEILLDPAIVAALNAKTKKTRSAEANHATQRTVPRAAGTPVAEMRVEPRRPAFSLFSLFGG